MGRRNRPGNDAEPLWRRTLAQWSEAKREEWEERAAIKQFMAGLSREQAEKEAWDELAAQPET